MTVRKCLPHKFLSPWYMLSLQLCPAVCDPVDCSLPGSSDHGILQARILEKRLAFPTPGDLPGPVSSISCIGRGVLYHSHHLGSSMVKPQKTVGVNLLLNKIVTLCVRTCLTKNWDRSTQFRTSLVGEWLRLSMKGTQVPALVRGLDPTSCN